MSRAQSEKVGRGSCLACGEVVTYRRSKGGFLTWSCDGCDETGYATPGGESYTKRLATIKNPAPPASSTPVPELPANRIPEPTPKGTRSAFSMDQL